MSDTNGTNGGKRLAVYAVPESRDGEKPFWPKIGIAFTNRDGSMNLILEALPLGTNKLQVREVREREESSRPASGARRNGFETVEVRP